MMIRIWCIYWTVKPADYRESCSYGAMCSLKYVVNKWTSIQLQSWLEFPNRHVIYWPLRKKNSLLSRNVPDTWRININLAFIHYVPAALQSCGKRKCLHRFYQSLGERCCVQWRSTELDKEQETKSKESRNMRKEQDNKTCAK